MSNQPRYALYSRRDGNEFQWVIRDTQDQYREVMAFTGEDSVTKVAAVIKLDALNDSSSQSPETMSYEDGLKRVAKTTERLKREMSEPRHLHESDVDDTAILLAENRAAHERIAALEAALREMVEPKDYPDAYWSFDSEWEQYTCGYCLGMSDVMIRKPGKSAAIRHEPDCPVVKAREVLGGE